MTKRKTILAIPILLLAVIISLATPFTVYASDSGYEPRLNARNSSISYYSSEKNVYFQTGTPMPNCVAYAYGRIYEMNGEAPKLTHGSAGDWYGMNKAAGYYDYGSEPKLGAVACWSNHVAIVEKISDAGITISESHWGGGYFDTRTYANMHDHFGQTFYGYIYTYNEGVTEEMEEVLLNSSKADHSRYKKEKDISPDSVSGFHILKLDAKLNVTPKDLALSKMIK